MTNMTNITADVNVGMNEVVSVFVSRYEDGLFAKKDEVAARIRETKSAMKAIEDALVRSVIATEYEADVPNLGIKFRLGAVSVLWEGGYNIPKNTLQINVDMFDSDYNKTASRITKTINQPILADKVEAFQYLKGQLESANAEMLEVMGLIKSVSRKERQIRGRISEMKLAQSGFNELLTNPEMLKLVELK